MCLLSEFRVVMAHYDFRIKTIFGSSLSPVVCRWAPVVYKGGGGLMLYCRGLCLFADSGVQHLFLFFFVLCTLCCRFL
jgi:hypothetical protein